MGAGAAGAAALCCWTSIIWGMAAAAGLPPLASISHITPARTMSIMPRPFLTIRPIGIWPILPPLCLAIRIASPMRDRPRS